MNSSISNPLFSLIICSRNRSQQLRNCLQSISAKEMLFVHAELILVDNASTDETLEEMKKFQKEQKYSVVVLQEGQIGLSKARNTAIKGASGEILIFTDDDCYLSPEYLLKAMEFFQKNKFHFVGGQIWRYDRKDSLICTRYFKKQIIIPPKSCLSAGLISGANMIITREVIQKIGYFDELLGAGSKLQSAEDIEYLSRASATGFTGVLVPDLIIWHHHQRRPKEKDEYLTKCNYDYGRGAYYLKNILAGRWIYLLEWICKSFYRWNQSIREIKGAYLYYSSNKID